jgi:signal peptidase II
MRPIDRQAMALLVVTLVADQVSKQLLLGFLLKAGAIVPVIDGFFRLVIVWNRGVSFGLFGGDQALPPWLLSGVAIAVCIGLFLWLRRTDRPLTGWGIGLVMGGAIGNVIDRARGERCSISPISTLAGGTGRHSMSPMRRSSSASGSC